MALATVTGLLFEKMPKVSHSTLPAENKIYIESEIPEVSFVLIVFIACGRKETVVQNAARKPVADIQFIIIF